MDFPLLPHLEDFYNKTYRLGIMGGTFDPIHFGHLVCAEQVKSDLKLNHVIFMPAGLPAFKQHKRLASAQERFEMVELAILDNPSFSVSSLEINTPNVTYTYKTLERLKAHYPSNVEFYFITGADVLVDILSWKHAEKLADLTNFVACTRPNYNLDTVVDTVFDSKLNFEVIYTEVPALAISSSYIRACAASKKTIRYLLPRTVEEYIYEHNLYESA